MIYKKWEEYTNDEKEGLLMHYFMYYGKTFISLEEFRIYNALCKEEPDTIFDYVLFAANKGPTALVYLIRRNIHKKALNEIKECMDKVKKEKKNEYEEYEKHVLLEILNTYNKPQSSIPFSKEQIIEEIKKLKL